MTKRIVIIISSVILFIFLVLIIKAVMKPKPFKWIPTYSSYDKQPYGGALIFRQLKNTFPGKKVKRFSRDDFKDYYWYIEDNLEYYNEDGEIVNDSSLLLYDMEYELGYIDTFNIVMIDEYFQCSDLNARAMLLHAYQGNEVFISSNHLDGIITNFISVDTSEDTTLIDEEYDDGFVIKLNDYLPVQLKSYSYYSHIISYPDSAEVIATNKKDQVLGIKLKIGKGFLTYFTIPLVFTNYYLLKQENNLAENLLLSLPNRDTYYGNTVIGNYDYPERESLLSFIHSQESLTWAFYTILISILFLMIFQNKNNKSLLKKKMTYFLEMIRSKYHLNTSIVDEVFLQQLATKSKVDIKTLKTIFRDYDILVNQEHIPNPELLHFNKKIQHFKHRK